MSDGTTCYEQDESLCEDQMCLRTGCRLHNEKKHKPVHGYIRAGREPAAPSDDITLWLRETAGKLVHGDVEDGSVGVAKLCEAAEEIERLQGLVKKSEAVKEMVRLLRRPSPPKRSIGAIQEAIDMQVNATIDLVLAAWPASLPRS